MRHTGLSWGEVVVLPAFERQSELSLGGKQIVCLPKQRRMWRM